MGLRDIVIPSATVTVSDGNVFAVRGFTLNDGLMLYNRHAGELSELFDRFQGMARAKKSVDAAQVGAAMVSGAPRIVAEIIAIASGSDPEGDDWAGDVKIALSLSGGVQMDALQKIDALTFTSDMPPGKFVGLVIAMAQNTTAVLGAPASPTT